MAETDEVIHSQWSDVRSFSIAQGPLAAIKLTAPIGEAAVDVPIENVGFTWSKVPSADSYTFVLSKSADLSSPIVTKTGLKDTAYSHAGPLDYSTTYYWRATALKGTNELSKSSVGTFTTVPAKVWTCPTCGLTFPSEEALKAHIAEAHAPVEPATPTWVWVVIGLGAVLVIVVIVLIFRTRRV